MQYEYINSRHIKNSHISRAIYRGYGTLLPRRMHPVYLIKLGLTPDEIDVNVHPAKIEVRLKNHQLVQTIISEQIQLQLRSQTRERYNIPATMENHAENTISQDSTQAASSDSLFSTREIPSILKSDKNQEKIIRDFILEGRMANRWSTTAKRYFVNTPKIEQKGRFLLFFSIGDKSDADKFSSKILFFFKIDESTAKFSKLCTALLSCILLVKVLSSFIEVSAE